MGVGLIFECFYFLHGSEDDRKMYLEHHTNGTFCDDQTKSRIIKRFGLPFAFTIAFQALMRTRGKCNTPMFYISLLDDYFGLSNQGFQARDTFKTGLSLQTYKHLKEVKNQELLAKTEEAMRNGLVVGGADNFNQQYFTSKVDARKTPLVNFNGCVGGVSLVPVELKMPKVDPMLCSIVHPDHLRTFWSKLQEDCTRAIESCGPPDAPAGSFRFFDEADVNKLGIFCVPLKMPAEVRLERGYPSHTIGVKHWRPLFIGPMNPAQNEGCWRMFMKLFDEMRLVYEHDHYMVIRFDVNIYNIYLRVISS